MSKDSKRSDRRRRSVPRTAQLAAALTLCVVIPRPAAAQIYSWRDANGNMMVSNRARPTAASTDVRSFPVPRAETVRATRYVASERGRIYDDLIDEHARLNGIRSDLVRAVVQVESAFNPYAKSPKGALGLMQLMPSTIERYGVKNPFNPVENVRAGVQYLRQLLDRYRDNEELALAAYNAGEGAVSKFGGIPPYRETQSYVSRILAIAGR
jgi:soluble lytic murein transglycosylase-like protein